MALINWLIRFSNNNVISGYSSMLLLFHKQISQFDMKRLFYIQYFEKEEEGIIYKK